MVYRITATVGYEWHDDYVETGSRTLEVPARGEIYNMAAAEREAHSILLAVDDDWDSRWCRIEKIELIRKEN